jgi:hypothetical protein
MDQKVLDFSSELCLESRNFLNTGLYRGILVFKDRKVKQQKTFLSNLIMIGSLGFKNH